MVRCVKAGSGQEVWSFATGGMLFRPPTLAQGRLLAGSCDGRVYCLNAKTGKSLWQFQAAPADRRVFWFGHLISTWPVLTGVAVQDGVAYTVAGYQKGDGIHAYALDLKNGQVIWENHTAGDIQSANFGCGGGLAVAAGKLWLAAGCFDQTNGVAKSIGNQVGGDVAVFDKWVLHGGRRISEVESDMAGPLGANIAMSGIDPKSGGLDIGALLPAWGASHLLMPPRGASGSLTLLSVEAFTNWFAGYPAARAAFDKAPKNDKPKFVDWPDIKVWATDGMTPASFVLAKDQAVVTYTDGRATHRVSGYNLADGTKLWTANLPEQPALDRLALDRDGHVLVALCDGSVVCLGR
jgi:hypothetical protein